MISQKETLDIIATEVVEGPSPMRGTNRQGAIPPLQPAKHVELIGFCSKGFEPIKLQMDDSSKVPIPLWKVGDIVTRDGTDEHVIIQIADKPQEYGDNMTVRCIKEPEAQHGNPPWCRIGDEESNLTRRYTWLRGAADASPSIAYDLRLVREVDGTLKWED